MINQINLFFKSSHPIIVVLLFLGQIENLKRTEVPSYLKWLTSTLIQNQFRLEHIQIYTHNHSESLLTATIKFVSSYFRQIVVEISMMLMSGIFFSVREHSPNIRNCIKLQIDKIQSTLRCKLSPNILNKLTDTRNRSYHIPSPKRERETHKPCEEFKIRIFRVRAFFLWPLTANSHWLSLVGFSFVLDNVCYNMRRCAYTGKIAIQWLIRLTKPKDTKRIKMSHFLI